MTRRREHKNLHVVEPDVLPVQRVAFYCRVSTDEQAEQNTVQMQLDYLRSRFRADFDGNGPVPMTHVDDFVDEGWSGAVPFRDRPDGARALDAARAHTYDVLAFYKVDRLGRKASVLLEAHEDLERLGVAITSATEPFDTRPGPLQAFGIFVFQLLGSIAQLERSTIETRTMGGKLRVAREGKFVNGAVPFGYMVSVAGLLVPNRAIVPELGIAESDLVTQLFERVAGGESCYALGSWLADLGVVSPRRWFNKKLQRMTEASAAAPWNNRRVWETIRNESYKGDRALNFKHEEHVQDVPALVSPEVWQQANERIKDHNPWKGTRDGHIYLLSRKIECSQCGLLYTGGLANGYRYYQCNGNDRRHGQRCDARMLRADRLEQAVWADLAWKIRNPEAALRQAQERLRERQTNSVALVDQRQELLKRREVLVSNRRFLRQQLTSGRRPAQELEEDLAESARAIAGVDGQIAELDAGLEVSAEMERQYAAAVPLLGDLGAELDDIEASQDRTVMRDILNRLVQRITVTDPKARTPNLIVDYTFSVGANTGSSDEFTNIQTVVVMNSERAA